MFKQFFFFEGRRSKPPFFYFGCALEWVALLNPYPDLTSGAEEFRTVEEPINATGPNRKMGKEKKYRFCTGPGRALFEFRESAFVRQKHVRARPRYARGNRWRHTILDAAKKRIPQWRLFFYY